MGEKKLPKTMSVKEFANSFGLSKATVYRYIQTGEIPIVPLPGKIRRIDYEKYIEQYGQGSLNEPCSLKTDSYGSSSGLYHQKGDTSWLD